MDRWPRNAGSAKFGETGGHEFGAAWPVFMFSNFPWGGIFFAPIYGLVIFALGEALDRATFKADRVNIEMYEAAA